VFTYLAIAFVLGLLALIIYGFGIVMRRPPTKEELTFEVCSLCRKKFARTELVERQIADIRVLWFCATCILDLGRELEGGRTPYRDTD